MPFCDVLEGRRKTNKDSSLRGKLSSRKTAPGSAQQTMADYIYLLETRLSKPQRAALQTIRDTARAHSLTLFLVGGAVRDLISGAPVRDLDIAVQGNALALLNDIQGAGAVITGKLDLAQAFFATFPGGVRTEVASTLSVTYPRPGKPEVQPASILDDLRRRDFTANSMALSLNEGSFGLLMDPLNGVADIENRELRLVSNYGFIEDPVRMIRAARFMARLAWRMDEKTEVRYQTGKEQNYIAALSNFHRGYESEELLHEEDPLRVMRRLEEEGWLKHLAPALSVSKANVAEIEKLREIQLQLQTQGVQTAGAAAYFPLLTAKLSETELAALKKSFARPGFLAEIETLDAAAKRFVAELTSKAAALPSQAYKMIVASEPETVLWAAYISKSVAFQAKLKNFYTDWPSARLKIPYSLMQEMRITAENPQYEELIERLFFEIMDGRLQTPEEIKTFLEPFSPPAPPPPVHLRRQRAAKKGAKAAKGRKKTAPEEEIDAEDDPDIDPDAGIDPDADRDSDRDPDQDSDEPTSDSLPASAPDPRAPDPDAPDPDFTGKVEDHADEVEEDDEARQTDPAPLPPAPISPAAEPAREQTSRKPAPVSATSETGHRTSASLAATKTDRGERHTGAKKVISSTPGDEAHPLLPPGARPAKNEAKLPPTPAKSASSIKNTAPATKEKAPAATKPTAAKVALSAPGKKPGTMPASSRSAKETAKLPIPHRSQPATKAAPPPSSKAAAKASAKQTPAPPMKSSPQKSTPLKAAPAKSAPAAKTPAKSPIAANLKGAAKQASTSPAKGTPATAKAAQPKAAPSSPKKRR